MRSLSLFGFLLALTTSVLSQADKTADAEAKAEALRAAGPEPLAQFGYVFKFDTPPRFAWGTPALAEHGLQPTVEEVAWFDAEGKRFEAPEHEGRWVAIVRSRLKDGRTVMRSVTLFATSKGLFLIRPETLGFRLEEIKDEEEPGPLAGHRQEIRRIIERPLGQIILGGQPQGARLLTALHDAKQEDAATLLRYGIEDRTRYCELQARLAYEDRQEKTLPPPRRLKKGEHATELRPSEKPVSKMALAEIDEICQNWANESDASFCSLAAKDGHILHHAAFSPEGKPAIGLDFRSDVFSITKSISGILAARFLDAGLFALDQPVSTVFPEFAEYPEHTPTFRQCMRHQSGLKGHGSWGGVGNVWFDHVVFNGIETLHPTTKQKYSGDGFDLVGTAMQLLTGETTARLIHHGYFEPLGLPPMPYDQMGSGGRPTVFQLAVLGQIMANRGRYGEFEFFSEKTFEAILPTAYEAYQKPDPDNKLHFYGLGIRWVRELKDEAGKPLFSRRTVGHGSFSFSVFLIDLENKIVVAQVREKNSKADRKWYPQFLRVVHRVTRGEKE